MTLVKRHDLPRMLETLSRDTRPQVALFFGERYLVREAADLLQNTLLQNNPGAVQAIDGDLEDAGKTLGRLMSFSLLPGLQIFRVNDTRLFQSKDMGANLWEKAVKEYETDRKPQALRYLLNMLSLAGISAESSEPFSELSPDQWRDSFATEKPTGDIGWADRLVQESGRQTTPKGTTGNLADLYLDAIGRGLPGQNILILTAENVDKRKRLFTHIKDHGFVVDCSVDTGAGSAAQKVQKEVLLEIMHKTLAGLDKKMEAKATALFLERTGFHPVAVAMESEKLALYAEDRPIITVEDVETMAGRSREDALFELTDAFGKRQIARTIVILHHLLGDGIHSLAILSTMRNYFRKLLIFRSLQLRPDPFWHSGMSASHFQGKYLPALKEEGEWLELLKGHPYALYMSFAKASEFSCSLLKRWLELLLQSEFRLKGSPLPQHLILEELLLSMLRQAAGQ